MRFIFLIILVLINHTMVNILKFFRSMSCMTKRNIDVQPVVSEVDVQKDVLRTIDEFIPKLKDEYRVPQPVVSSELLMMNTELMMFQQMCSMFGKQFTISSATEYLDKLNFDISKSEVKDMYSKEIFTLITDFRENRIEQLQKLLETN